MISKALKTSAQEQGRLFPAVPLIYQPERWNADSVVSKFNCYSYALNTQDFGWLPLFGFLGSNKQSIAFPLSEEFALRASPSLRAELWLPVDGLKQIRKHEHSPAEKHIIAYDSHAAHFYRLDGDGIWSHKLGRNLATNRDDMGNVMHDLENADFMGRAGDDYGGTSANIRYFILPEEGLKILHKDVRENAPYQRIKPADMNAPTPVIDDRGKSVEQILREVDEAYHQINIRTHRRAMQRLPYKMGAVEL